MIEFSMPYMFLLLPVPLLGRWLFFLDSNKANGFMLRIPFFNDLKKIKLRKRMFYHTNYLKFLLLLIAWILLVMAAARPIQIADSWSIDVEGRDLMIAIDASGSMARPETINGVQSTRFEIVQNIINNLVEKRKGDRIGIIIFGTKAFLYSPLSFDTSLVQDFINEAFAGMAGPSTAIGDALMLSVKYLHDRPSKNKVVILMTDGTNQGGRYSIEQAMEVLKNIKVKIYVIGIGFTNAEHKNPLKDAEIDLDEPSLIEIARQSRGQYFRVNTPNDFEKVVSYIEQIEKIEASLILQSVDELYYVFVFWAVIVLIFMVMLHIYSVYRANKEYGKGVNDV